MSTSTRETDDLVKAGLLLEQSCDQLIIEVSRLKKKVKGMVDARRADYIDWLRDEIEHMTYELKQDNLLVKSAPMAGGNP
jgi:hypothetical protein